jgi:hypothetical protein
MLLLLFEKLTSIIQNPWQMDSGTQEAPIHCASSETITPTIATGLRIHCM